MFALKQPKVCDIEARSNYNFKLDQSLSSLSVSISANKYFLLFWTLLSLYVSQRDFIDGLFPHRWKTYRVETICTKKKDPIIFPFRSTFHSGERHTAIVSLFPLHISQLDVILELSSRLDRIHFPANNGPPRGQSSREYARYSAHIH